MQTAQITQSGVPSETEETITLKPEWQLLLIAYVSLIRTVWKKIVLVLLTAQGLYGLFVSIIFLFQTYPQLEQQLLLHEISQAAVQIVIIKAVVLLISTIIEIIIAIRLAQKQTMLSETIDAVIGTGLLLFSQQITNYLVTHKIFSHFIG